MVYTVYTFVNQGQWCSILVYAECTIFYTESGACVVGCSTKPIWWTIINVMIGNLTYDLNNIKEVTYMLSFVWF